MNTAPGKRIHGAVYLHADACRGLPPERRAAVEQAAASLPEGAAWNVAKLEPARPHRVSLLLYESFDAEPFPALLESRAVDLQRGTVKARSFRRSANPPILHRKELLLPEGDPRRPGFAALTAALEAKGAFAGMARMGFRKPWAERLAGLGLRVEGHRLVEAKEACDAPDGSGGPAATGDGVARHRTAIGRDRLSAPVQALLRHGLIDEATPLLDYGCGRGDDVRALRAAGYAASGWDPHFAPEAPRDPAFAVNLGYVLNVIEEPAERVETLRGAWALARAVLAVAVLVEGKADTAGQQPHRDGYLTRRGTFQKYFRPDEFRALLRDALGREPVAAAPGLAFVFADEGLEQTFLAERQRRRSAWRVLTRLPPVPPREPGAPRPSLAQRRLEAWRPHLERLWARALDLGREPEIEELPPDLRAAVEGEVGSLKRALKACRGLFDGAELGRSAAARAEDLRVHFALNLCRRTAYRELPAGLRRDVKAFFGGLKGAREQAQDLLFSMAEPGAVERACAAAAADGLCAEREPGRFALRADRVGELPALARCFVGCAGWLYGDLGGADLVELRPAAAKVALERYRGFGEDPAPVLEERATVDLRRQQVKLWAPASAAEAPVLLDQARFLDADDPSRSAL